MIIDSATAAVAVAGYNLTAGKRYQVNSGMRHLKGLMLVGSTSPNDTQVDVYAGDTFISSLRNSRGGANLSPQTATDYMQVDVGIEPNEPIHLIVVTAPTTNAIVWALDIDGV